MCSVYHGRNRYFDVAKHWWGLKVTELGYSGAQAALSLPARTSCTHTCTRTRTRTRTHTHTHRPTYKKRPVWRRCPLAGTQVLCSGGCTQYGVAALGDLAVMGCVLAVHHA